MQKERYNVFCIYLPYVFLKLKHVSQLKKNGLIGLKIYKTCEFQNYYFSLIKT